MAERNETTSDIAGIGKAAASVEMGTREVRELLSLFFKPPITELGLWAGDWLRIQRERQFVKTMAKAKSNLDNAGIEIKSVQLKLMVPLMDACSLENEEDMSDRWANLLAAAASGNSVLPSHVQLLSALSSDEARFLDSLKKLQQASRPKGSQGWRAVCGVSVMDLRLQLRLSQNEYNRLVINLFRLGLVDVVHKQEGTMIGDFPFPPLDDKMMIGTTAFGDDFLAVCNKPPEKVQPLDLRPSAGRA